MVVDNQGSKLTPFLVFFFFSSNNHHSFVYTLGDSNAVKRPVANKNGVSNYKRWICLNTRSKDLQEEINARHFQSESVQPYVGSSTTFATRYYRSHVVLLWISLSLRWVKETDEIGGGSLLQQLTPSHCMLAPLKVNYREEFNHPVGSHTTSCHQPEFSIETVWGNR